MQIKFRPHHFLCALNFQGRGYSPAFVKNFSLITDILKAPDGDDVLIHVTDHTDSICNPCPSRRETLCVEQEKVSHLDQMHASALDIKTNTVISWGEAKERITNKISLTTFHSICTTCEWKASGLCESSLTQFLDVQKEKGPR